MQTLVDSQRPSSRGSSQAGSSLSPAVEDHEEPSSEFVEEFLRGRSVHGVLLLGRFLG